jgi:hypothetical protein
MTTIIPTATKKLRPRYKVFEYKGRNHIHGIHLHKCM